MPVTPLHFGPGFALKSVIGGWFSFTLFCLVQVLIDLEPGYYMLIDQDPLHRFLHTYLGATLAGIVALAGKPLCEWSIRIWNRWLSPAQARWLGAEARIPWRAAVIGSLAGAWSHVGLDSLMHADMRPFAPWSEARGPLYWVDIDTLYVLCAAAGGLGLAIHFVRRIKA